MGIYERDYIRRPPPQRGAYGRGGLSSMRMWSVNTWLIVICVGVFVINQLTPMNPTIWKPVQVSRTLPPHVDVLGGPQYQEVSLGDEVRALTTGRLYFVHEVVDTSVSPPEKVGSILYEWMPPLHRWLHFSTDRGFRRLEVWRFVGFQFLHGGLTHLLFNMVGLFFFGSLVERYLGSKRYLAFYLLCGIFGALMYLLLNLGGYITALKFGQSVAIPGLLFNSPSTPLIGASAGVFGVLMAGAFLAPNAIVLLFFILPMRLATLAYALVIIALINVIFGGNNAGGEAGHLGGAIAGFYFIRHPHHLHGFFDFMGRIDPTSHHYRGKRRRFGRGPKKESRSDIDRILDKISDRGLHSLTDKEKRLLRDASKRD